MMLLISGLMLLLALLLVAEGAADHYHRRANPEREATRPHFKIIWQLVAVVGWSALGSAVRIHYGEFPTFIVAVISLVCYGAFRYRLARSPAMQRRFLRSTIPLDEPPATNREP